MAIQISGTTVIDNSRNLTCIESVSGNGIATQAEAEAGTVNNQIMTPLRVSQAIAALGGGMVDDDINWSTCNVGCAVRGGGNVVYKTGGVIWITAPSYTFGLQPTGYGDNGPNGSGSSYAASCTGRDGWFVPSAAQLPTLLNCRAYWNSFCNNYHWSTTPSAWCACQSGYYAYFGYIPYSNYTCQNQQLPYTNQPYISMRVVCY